MRKLKLFSPILLAVFFMSVLNSCKQKPAVISGDASAIIPQEASNVSSFNPRQLMEKADFESIKTMEFYQDGLEKAKSQEPALAAVLEDPAKSGIDLDKNAYFFSELSENGSMDMVAGLAFSLADAQQFSDLLKSADVGGFTKGNGFSYATPESGSIIAWNDNTAFIGGGPRETNIVKVVEGMFNSSGNNSISNNPNFQNAIKGDHDITTYASFDAYTEMLPEAAKLQLGAVGIAEADLKGNHISGFLDFNDGEVYSESEINLSKNIEKDLNMFFNDKVSTDFSPYVPAEGLTSFMTFAMDVKGTNQLLKEKGVAGFANLALARYGLTSDDLAGAIGGDIMLAAFANQDNNTPEMLFGTNIEDKSTLDKFIQAGKDAGFLFAEGGDLYTLRGTSGALNDALKGLGPQSSVTSSDAQLLIKDGKIFISSRKDIISKINAGGYAKAERVEAARYNGISKNIFGMYLDFNGLSKWSDNLEVFQFNDMTIKSSRKNSQMRMTTNNQDENSLKSIFRMMNDAYKKDKMNIRIDDKDKKQM